jgi:hypothetical protein
MSDEMNAYRIQAQYYDWDNERLDRAIEEQSMMRRKWEAEIGTMDDPMKIPARVKAVEGAVNRLAEMLFERDRRKKAGPWRIEP